MNDSTPFDTIGDGPLEARIVAWVLGEASAFEAAELERLCEERPELLVFRRRMRALHGLLTESEAAEPDDGWKLPPEKRKALEEIFGEEDVVRLEPDKEIQIRRSGRRALLAIAACVTLAFVVIRLLPREFESEMIIEVKPRETGVSPLADAAPGSPAGSQMTPEFFGTEFEKIKSRNSLSKVVDTLELENRWNVDKETAIRMLKDSVTTENIKGTDLIALRVRNASAEDAKNIASEVGRAYKEYRTEIENRYADKKLYELNKAVRDQEDKVEERRKVLATIVRTKGIIYKGKDSFYGSAGVNEDKGAQDALETYNQVAQEKQRLEGQINSLLKYDSDQLLTYAGGLNLPDNTIKNLYPQYLEGQRELNKLKTQGLGEDHPTVKAAKEQVEGMKRQLDEGVVNLRATLQAQANMASDRLKSVETRRDDTREESIKRGLDAQDYVDAKRDFETDQELLQQLKLKQVAETITNKLPHDSIEVHDEAEVRTRLAIPFFSKTPAPAAIAANSKSGRAVEVATVSQPLPASAAPSPPASPSALADNKPATESESAPVDGLKDLASAKGTPIFNYTTEYEPELPQATRAPAELSESGERFFSTRSATGTASTLAGEKNDLAAGDGTGRMAGDNAVLLPARKRSVSGAKSELAYSDSDAKPSSRATGDFISPVNGTTVDGIPADRGQLASGGVTNGLRMGDQAINRNNIDAILNNPNRTVGETIESDNGDQGLAGKLTDRSKFAGGSASTNSEYAGMIDPLSRRAPVDPGLAADSPANEPAPVELAMEFGQKNEPSPGAGGGAGGSYGLSAGDEIDYYDKTSPMAVNRGKDIPLGLEVAKQLEPEIAAASDAFAPPPAEGFSYKMDGPVAAPAAAAPELKAAQDLFDPGWKSTGGRQLNTGNQLGLNEPGLDNSSGPQQQSAAKNSAADASSLAERELIRRQDAVVEGDRILAEGRDAYSKGDYQKAMDKYSETLKKLPESPMLADRRESYEQHLNDAKIALAMQNRKVGKYDEARSLLQGVISGDPNNNDAKRELDYLEDPIRTDPALAYEHTQNVDQVRRGLYTAEGNLNLGKYDDAKHDYENVLRIDPYNSAARRGMEKLSQAKTDYYRAAYDHTRAELLMQVDNAWELKVPAKEEEKNIDDKEKAEAGEANDEIGAIDKKTGGVEYEIHAGTSEYLFRGLDLSKTSNVAPPAKKSPLESMEEIAASEEAYSTFSLNINDASFQIAKAALEKGDRPDPEAIKVEQFYNAVDYGDPAPAANEPVAATIEQAAHPIIPGRNLVRVSLKTAAAGRGASQPLRLTLLVDQSGSMVREDRRTAMFNALKQLGGLLTLNDHITVVGFSRESHLLADNWTGDKAGKLGDLVNQTASEGGTNLEQAINLAEQMAARPHPAGEQNRIVLFTDGAANLGNANPERLAERVKSLRQQGIAFDIAGIGADGVNDRLLSELARNGNGRYYVVGDSKNESFARQLAGAFRPAAENVKVQVHFNPERVGRYKLIGFEKDRLKTEDFRNDAVDAAELAAEEAGVAIYQVETLAQGSGEIGEVSVRFRDTSKGEMVERNWTMPFESTTQAFDRATPSMQLAGLSMLAAEKLKGGPLADAIDFQQLSGSQSLVKQFYGSSPRVADMLHVIDLLK